MADSSGDTPSPNAPLSGKRPFLIWITATMILLLAAVAGTHWYDGRPGGVSETTGWEILPGPWGDVRVRPLRLDPPQELILPIAADSSAPVWNFGNLTTPSVRSVLTRAGCTEQQADCLLATPVPSADGSFRVRPDPSTVLLLDPVVRERVYAALSANPANRLQASPIHIPDGNVEEFLGDPALFRTPVVDMVGKLSYRRNGFTYFSDPELVLAQLKTDAQKQRFLRILFSEPAVQMSLRIMSEKDVDKPLLYWSSGATGTRLSDLRPLLEAQARRPGGGAVSVFYLLPPTVREKLFASALSQAGQDSQSHWLSLNSFTDHPDARMTDSNYAARQIEQNYYQIGQPGTLGDIILLLDDKDRVIHSAVFVAAGVVFTKDGTSASQPWVLMRQEDLVGRYSALAPVKVACFRSKGL